VNEAMRIEQPVQRRLIAREALAKRIGIDGFAPLDSLAEFVVGAIENGFLADGAFLSDMG
jgi:hypothetical protein